MDIKKELGAAEGLRFYSLARHALVEALRLAGAEGAGVLLPAFICRDVMAPLHAVGATPEFYAVDANFLPGPLPGTPGIKAVMAVNYFGFAQPLAPFHDYCARTGAALIEDNAHGTLSRDEAGTPLGARGDAGLYSLYKTFGLPEGAALAVNRHDWLDRLAPALAPADAPPGVGHTVKRALGAIQEATGIKVRNAGQQLARASRRVRTGHAFPQPSPEDERVIPMAPAISRQSLQRLESVDAGKEAGRRRGLYARFEALARTHAARPVFGVLPQNTVPYGFPFRGSDAAVKALSREAARDGWTCSLWPDLPDAVLAGAPAHYRDLWWISFT